MFSLKNFFGFNTVTVSKSPKKETNVKAFIQPLSNGRHGLFNGGEMIGSYARARDAKRGAARRGLSVVEA